MDEFTIWVIQCRNDGMNHAALFFYKDEDEAFAEEEKFKKEYQYVALEEWSFVM